MPTPGADDILSAFAPSDDYLHISKVAGISVSSGSRCVPF